MLSRPRSGPRWGGADAGLSAHGGCASSLEQAGTGAAHPSGPRAPRLISASVSAALPRRAAQGCAAARCRLRTAPRGREAGSPWRPPPRPQRQTSLTRHAAWRSRRPGRRRARVPEMPSSPRRPRTAQHPFDQARPVDQPTCRRRPSRGCLSKASMRPARMAPPPRSPPPQQSPGRGFERGRRRCRASMPRLAGPSRGGEAAVGSDRPPSPRCSSASGERQRDRRASSPGRRAEAETPVSRRSRGEACHFSVSGRAPWRGRWRGSAPPGRRLRSDLSRPPLPSARPRHGRRSSGPAAA